MTPEELAARREQVRVKILNDEGYNPDEYDITPEGDIFYSPRKAPAPKSSALEAGGRSALYHAPEAIGGLGGAALASWLLGPEAGVPMTIAATLLGGFAGGNAASEIKSKLIPQPIQESEAKIEAEHPTAAKVGSLIPQALLMRPSPSNLQTAGRGLVNIFRQPGRIPLPQQAALANVGLGAGLGAASSVGSDILHGERPNVKQALESAAEGAVFNEPTKLGQLVSFGQFHSTPVDGSVVDTKAVQRAVAGSENLILPKKSMVDSWADALVAGNKILPDQRGDIQTSGERFEAMTPAGRDRYLKNLYKRVDKFQAGMNPENAAELDTFTQLYKYLDHMSQLNDMLKTQEPDTPDARTGSVKAAWADFMGKVAQRHGVDLQVKPSVADTAGVPVAGASTQRVNPAAPALAEISIKGGWDTYPHEIFHSLINDIEMHGTEGERAWLAKARKSFGGDNEAFTQAVGEHFVGRILKPGENSAFADIGASLRSWLGRATSEDYARLGSSLLAHGAGTERLLTPSLRAYGIDSDGKEFQQLNPGPISKDDIATHDHFIITAHDAHKFPQSGPGYDDYIDKIVELEDTPHALIATAQPHNGHTPSMLLNFPEGTAKDVQLHILAKAKAATKNFDHDLIIHDPDGDRTTFEEYENRLRSTAPKRDISTLPTPELPNLTAPLASSHQVDSPEFRQWFGKSKVVDENGNPKLIFHGTRGEPFDTFDPTMGEGSGIHAGSREQAFDRIMYLNDFKQDGALNKKLYGVDERGYHHPYRMYPLFGRLENPIEIHDVFSHDATRAIDHLASTGHLVGNEIDQARTYGWSIIRPILQSKGYDGFIYKNTGEGAGGTDHTAYAFFDPNQVKSASGNNGEFSRTDNRVQYQRFQPPTATPSWKRKFTDPFSSELEKLRAGDEPRQYLAKKIMSLFNNQRTLAAKYNVPIQQALVGLTKDQKTALYEHMIDESRTGIKLRAAVGHQLLPAYDTIRHTLETMARDQISAGQKVNGRTRGVDPTYFPNVLNPRVADIFANQQGTPAHKQLSDEFVAHNAADIVARNPAIQPADALKEAAARLDRYKGSFAGVADENPFEFKAVRSSHGVVLPDSWLSPDIGNALERYVNRFTRDRVFFDTVEKDARSMALLGAKRFNNNQKIPPALLAQEHLAKDPSVISLLSSYKGSKGSQTGLLDSFGRVVNSAILGGPITRATDLLTTPLKALPFLSPEQVVPAMWHAFSNWHQSYVNAIDRGLISPTGHNFMREAIGATEGMANRLDQLAAGINTWSGSEALETAARTLAQGLGEYIARVSKTGSAADKAFLDKVAPDWAVKGMRDSELGAHIARIFQGKYDATNLPAWMKDSKAAPFFSMMRWNVEQWNNFKRYAIEPITQPPAGTKPNFGPAIATVFAGLVGGLGIEEFRQLLTGRKDYTVTFKEYQNAHDEVRATGELAGKLAQAMQLTGTFGIMSEFIKQGIDVMNHRMPQGFRFPVADVVQGNMQMLVSAVQAISQGEPFDDVFAEAMRQVMNTNVQMFRIAWDELGRTGMNDHAKWDYDQHNHNRDKAMFMSLAGYPVNTGTFSEPSLTSVTLQKFRRETDVNAMVDEASILRNKAMRRFAETGDPGELTETLRSFAEPGKNIAPSIKTQPVQFAHYIQFIRDTQGDAEAKALIQEYARRNALGSAKERLLLPPGGRR